jgi:hypothetical protein
MNVVSGSFDNKIKLSVCIFTSDLVKHEQLSSLMTDYTTFYAHRLKQISTKLDILYADSIDDGLRKYSKEYEHILFLASGVRIFDDSIILDIENEIISNSGYLAAAHILDWKDDWYELHHQFILVNVKNWIKIGCPKFGNNVSGIDDLIVIERSIENFHDDYTPLWIRPTGKVIKRKHCRQGWNFINQAHLHGLSIINWNQRIRDKRTYYYPETDSSTFYNCWINRTYDNRIKNYNQQKILSEIITGVADQIWAVNSEYLDLNSRGQKFECVVLPASGFKFLDIFKSRALTNDGEIILYDFNSKSLDWIKHIHSSNTTNIKELVRTFKYKQNLIWFNSKNTPILSQGILNPNFQESFNRTVDYFDGKFYNYLDNFKKSKVTYIHVDLVTNPYPLINYIGDRKCLLQISNIFSTDFLTSLVGFNGSVNLLNRLQNTLHFNTHVVGQSPEGKFISWK